MKKHKKGIFITLAAVLILAVTVGAVAIAQADNEGTQTVKENLYERVAQVYQANTGDDIDATALKEAFTQARQELAAETKDQMWQKLIDEGKITQEQLEELKAWLEAKPEIPIDEFKQWMESKPDIMTDEFKQWLEARPEGFPFGLGKSDRFPKRGFHRIGGMFRGWCAPDDTE